MAIPRQRNLLTRAERRALGARMTEIGRPLTPGQLNVLREHASDLSGQEVADKLGLSVQTVRTHMGQVYARLNVHSLVGAFRSIGWLRVPGEADVRRLRAQMEAAALEEAIERASVVLDDLRSVADVIPSESSDPASLVGPIALIEAEPSAPDREAVRSR